MPTPQELLLSLARAYSLAEIHFSGDPELNEGLEAVREAQELVGWVVVRVGPEDLTVRGQVVGDEHREIEDLRQVLEAAGIRELRLQQALAPGELEDFVRRLNPSYPEPGLSPSARFRGLERVMGLSFRAADASPSGMAGSIQGLFQHRSMTPDETASRPDPPRKATETEASDQEGAAPAIRLEEEVRRYLAASGPDRAETGARIRRETTRLTERRELVVVLDFVEHLAAAAAGTPQDEELQDLVSDLVTPAVAGMFLSRLASTADDQERQRLTDLTPWLGREVAEALAEGLRDARDRNQRRAFLDALVTLGPVGMEVATRMVEDARWYVVRNGVAILGEVGGEEAVLHLTAALGNQDARVRKESVLALAKVGGGDAKMLILGMLDDSDASVRAGASRALGALRVQRAVRPLLEVLERDSDADVQVEGLRALGQIGDPGAVPLIERKAVGGFLRRPPQEIRIAAYRALAGIGTPHARELLRRAINDRDPRVRAVIKTLLLSG